MKTSIGIRLDEDFIGKLEEMGQQESLDRSTMIRKLLERGYRDYLKEKAAEGYRRGELTMSGAADMAGITVWEMEKYLIDRGYKSEYSIKDLKEESGLLE